MSKNAKSWKSEKWAIKMRKKNRKIAKFRNADFDRYLIKQRQSNRVFGKTEQKVRFVKNGKFRNFSFFKMGNLDHFWSNRGKVIGFLAKLSKKWKSEKCEKSEKYAKCEPKNFPFFQFLPFLKVQCKNPITLRWREIFRVAQVHSRKLKKFWVFLSLKNRVKKA